MPMPSFPVSLLIEQQIKPLIEGKVISDIKCEKYYTGKYSWHGEHLQNLDRLKNSKIIYADSNFIVTDSNFIAEFGYNNGDLRYFANAADVNISPSNKSVSDGYILTFYLDDSSCLMMVLYGWSTRFSIRKNDAERITVMPKSPVEVTDDTVFTLERFRQWLSEKGNMNIVENCSTAKGAFDIYNPVMSYILLISNIHPRTKTKKLSDTETEKLYKNIKSIVNDYRSGNRICEYTDIFGNSVAAENDVVRLTSHTLGKPCPICGTLIEFTPCAGTKIYFCPNCQKIK